MNNFYNFLNLLKIESIKQQQKINLIASENYSSLASIIYSSSSFINKYTEGYPFNRYYSGCKIFDYFENKSIIESQLLFSSLFSNVQPHSGVQANFSVFQTLLKKNDKILSLDLKSGGHLSHGFKKNFSGEIFEIVNYCLDKNNFLNYNYIELLLKKEKPKLIIIGYSCYQSNIDWNYLKYITKKQNCLLLSDISHISGFICSGLICNPIKNSDIVTSTTHKTLRGAKGGIILSNNNNYFKKINSSVFPGQQGGCISNLIISKYISFKEANNFNFINYSKQILINSKIMLKVFLYRGYKSLNLDTINHMFVIHLKNKFSLKIEKQLEKNGILINKNFFPNDNKNSINPSAIRIGLSAITTRKLKNFEVELLSNIICNIIENNDINYKDKINFICNKFPIYK
ncbi:serine hydroxymethyltransferase [Candidatus Carsonella ruddii HT isolate Thao2000]|uniref:Serine hydroxymethyltransferase n=1 Tax=Candidatus Carsonella ruddii HT isolate Thao2000 TaxID=1202539 RepID=J3TEE5_CARRU|nr:serine hydroxymethyltransferase [Candidatus Carsonella ruddii]AFP84077.1 serine hydroxymethyltransferase [Candidatus Carsonella ruddii HT isolate Thao2000]